MRAARGKPWAFGHRAPAGIGTVCSSPLLLLEKGRDTGGLGHRLGKESVGPVRVKAVKAARGNLTWEETG